jgi:ATP-dependent helicase/nuclease subunit B
MTLKTKYIQLFSNLNANTIILTPNRRLSATLHKLFQQYQLEQHRTVWPTPNILPLGLYLEQHFTSTSSLSLLSTIQEQCLWEKILTESKESSFLLQITETAEIARSARNLLCAWRVDLSLPDFTETNEYIIFKKWITDFECIIKEQSLIDQAALPDYLAKQILEKKIILNSHLILLGFNEITPQLHYFLSSCKSANNTVTIFSDSLKTTKQENCFRIKFKTDEEEILHIARLCKNIYDKNPTANIGCVFPSLEKKRDRVFQLFSQIFADENKLHADQNCLPFNISAGKPLLHYSIIQLAIQLLSLYKKNISIDAMGYLLTSPFLGEAETEKFKRAHLDVMLRKENLRQIDLTQLSFIQNICPLFTKRLTDFLNAIPPLHQANSYSAWAKKFGELLTLWGFPGERSLNSHEYQVIEQFLNLLNELSSLNQIFNNINYTHALNTLKKMAAKQIFQFKTPETSIQILGLLEAASLPFNYLFVAEMHDLSWPSKPNPNPLIPKSLQRRLQMPHASADRELIYCENLTNLFKQSAEQIIFSFAEKKEELDLEPSPLIRDIPEISFEKLLNTPYQSVHEKIYQIKKLEKIIDNQASIIEPHEKILGGSDIFKRQALCPFKAFAESRLHAKPLEIPTLGLRAKDRGVLLHKALEQIWNQISDHQTLINLNNINLNNYIF